MTLIIYWAIWVVSLTGPGPDIVKVADALCKDGHPGAELVVRVVPLEVDGGPMFAQLLKCVGPFRKPL